MFLSHTMFIGGMKQQPELIEIFTFSGLSLSRLVDTKTDFKLNNIIATSLKNSPANVIKVSAAILNLVSFSLFDRRDSDKPEKINIPLLSGSAVA